MLGTPTVAPVQHTHTSRLTLQLRESFDPSRYFTLLNVSIMQHLVSRNNPLEITTCRHSVVFFIYFRCMMYVPFTKSEIFLPDCERLDQTVVQTLVACMTMCGLGLVA